MKSDFEHEQHQEYFTNWKKSYDAQKELPNNFLNELPGLRYAYEAHLQPNTRKPLLIEEDNLPFLLSISQEKSHILIDSSTYYVKDIRDRKDTPFNTIVFSLTEPPLVTREVSKVVMERYFDQKPLCYAFIQSLGKSFGFHQRCPFVSGHEIFIPEKGSTNNSTSWYAAHHILYVVELKKTNQMRVFFRQHHDLLLDISPHSFKEQIDRATTLSHVQYKLATETFSLFNNTQTSHRADELNIIEKRLMDPGFVSTCFTLKEFTHFMSHYRLSEWMEKTFGEKNPYIDESRADLFNDDKEDKHSK